MITGCVDPLQLATRLVRITMMVPRLTPLVVTVRLSDANHTIAETLLPTDTRLIPLDVLGRPRGLPLVAEMILTGNLHVITRLDRSRVVALRPHGMIILLLEQVALVHATDVDPRVLPQGLLLVPLMIQLIQGVLVVLRTLVALLVALRAVMATRVMGDLRVLHEMLAALETMLLEALVILIQATGDESLCCRLRLWRQIESAHCVVVLSWLQPLILYYLLYMSSSSPLACLIPVFIFSESILAPFSHLEYIAYSGSGSLILCGRQQLG